MRRLRWALARLLAPERIIRDPFPDEEGVFVYYRSGPRTQKYLFEWVAKAERFRMKSTLRLASLDYPAEAITSYRLNRPFVRFVGTVGSP